MALLLYSPQPPSEFSHLQVGPHEVHLLDHTSVCVATGSKGLTGEWSWVWVRPVKMKWQWEKRGGLG